MAKTYIKAVYRIKGVVYNEGYICIDGNSTIGLFALDSAIISIVNKKLYFHLVEYEYKDKSEFKNKYNTYHPAETFISTQSVDYIEFPHTYLLRSKSNPYIFLSLELIKKVDAFELCANTLQRFENFYSK